jgi:hypothetical protein
MVQIKRFEGNSPQVYEIIAQFAMDHDVMKKRGNVPIITKDTYTWHVLMEGKKVKAFVGMEQVPTYTKLQAFVVLDATKAELRGFVKEVVNTFRKTQYPKLTISVLNEYVDIFAKEQFEILNHKVNWTDLAFFNYEEA